MELTSWALLRTLKFVALLLLGAGTLIAVRAPSRAARLQGLYRWLVPGVLGVWIAGWLLMKARGLAVFEPWILAAIVASGGGLHAAFLASHLPSPRPLTSWLAIVGFVGSVVVMVLRPRAPLDFLWVVLLTLLGSAFFWAPRESASAPNDEATMVRGFVWISRLEAVSFLVLLGGMVVRGITGTRIDGETRLVAWVHGVSFVMYLQALGAAGGQVGWSRKTRAIGAVAGLLPFGPFVFERSLGTSAPPVRKESL
ncbi:MAG: DUF3817 domain-containing protein [Myxococcota bacterium]